MNIFDWGESYKIDIDIIDHEHEMLISLLNKYSKAIASNKDVENILNDLMEYSKTHFHNEEKYMIKYNICIDHLNEHRYEHRDFVNYVNNMLSSSLSLGYIEHENILNFIVNWVVNHILGIDKSMSRQINAIKRGINPLVAFQYENERYSNDTKPLIEALNRLFIKLTEKNLELYKLNEKLEQKVLDRTLKLNQISDKYKSLSYRDDLTMLFNRRFAINKLEHLWRGDSKIGCIMLDLDCFKSVNDTYGHDYGDLVLKEFSNLLGKLSHKDDFVCRLGGDEFLIIINSTDDITVISKFAEDILLNINNLVVLSGNEVIWKGKASIGFSFRDNSMANYEDLLKKVDQALYYSKRNGKNKIGFIE